LSDADSGSTSEQQRISGQVVDAAEFFLEPLILFRGERLGRYFGARAPAALGRSTAPWPPGGAETGAFTGQQQTFEPATNNAYDYGVNKDVENLPHLRERMSQIIDSYHNVQQDVLETLSTAANYASSPNPPCSPTEDGYPASSSITRGNWP
jgi:hypothetical protein